MAQSVTLSFRSERFDYTSDLPDTANAGNRFYGRDVAGFVAARLTEQGFGARFLDEDWGWLVVGTPDAPVLFEVAVYNLADHGEGGRPGIGAWGLRLRAYERKKLLGLLPRTVDIPVPEALTTALRRAIGSAGAEAEPWTDGPD